MIKLTEERIKAAETKRREKELIKATETAEEKRLVGIFFYFIIKFSIFLD